MYAIAYPKEVGLVDALEQGPMGHVCLVVPEAGDLHPTGVEDVDHACVWQKEEEHVEYAPCVECAAIK